MRSKEKTDENAVFGYGSLILPTSLVGRFVDLESSVDPIYEDELGLDDEDLTRDEAEKVWNEIKEDIEVLPIKIPGFRRKYKYESRRGGAMLGLERTEDDEDYINGVMVAGLDEEQKEKMDSTEEGYKRVEVPSDDIGHYLGDEELEELDVEMPEQIEVYFEEEDSEKFNEDTSRTRNETYHARILKGIEMLEDLFDEEVVQEFYEDFVESTYERNFLTEEDWIETSYNDALEYHFSEED